MDWIASELDSCFHDLRGSLQKKGFDPSVIGFGGTVDPEAHITDTLLRLVGRESVVTTTLRRIGDRDARILWWRFGQPIPKALVVFGREDGFARRATPSGPYVRLHIPHGPGNLVHLTAGATEAFKREGGKGDPRPWCTKLGNRLQNGGASPGDRSLASLLQAQCREDEARAQVRYAQERPSRNARWLHRAALARCG